MDWQALIAAALVLACTGYAAWSLMPQALRRTLAGWFGKALPAGSGGCDSCGSCGDAKAVRSVVADGQPRESVIQIVRRPPN